MSHSFRLTPSPARSHDGFVDGPDSDPDESGSEFDGEPPESLWVSGAGSASTAPDTGPARPAISGRGFPQRPDLASLRSQWQSGRRLAAGLAGRMPALPAGRMPALPAGLGQFLPAGSWSRPGAAQPWNSDRLAIQGSEWTYPFIASGPEFQAALDELAVVHPAHRSAALCSLCEILCELPENDRLIAAEGLLSATDDLAPEQASKPLAALVLAGSALPAEERDGLNAAVSGSVEHWPCSTASRVLLGMAIAASADPAWDDDGAGAQSAQLGLLHRQMLLCRQIAIRLDQCGSLHAGTLPRVLAELVGAAALCGMDPALADASGRLAALPLSDRLSVMERLGGLLGGPAPSPRLADWLAQALAQEIADCPGQNAALAMLPAMLRIVDSPSLSMRPAQHCVQGWIGDFPAEQIEAAIAVLPDIVARLHRHGRVQAVGWVIDAVHRRSAVLARGATLNAAALGQAIGLLPPDAQDAMAARFDIAFQSAGRARRLELQNALSAGLREPVPQPGDAALAQFRQEMLGWSDMVSPRVILNALRALAPKDREEAKALLIGYSRGLLFSQAAQIALALLAGLIL